MSEKVQPKHRERAAYVYVRQSTRHQIRKHPESRKRQYGNGQRVYLFMPLGENKALPPKFAEE